MARDPCRRTQTPAPAVPVVAEKLQASDVPIVMTGIGSVVAYNVVDIHAQVTGTIEQIGFVEGQVVHPNSLIAQLDQRPFQAALQQAEANLARDQANLANARLNLGRFTPLLKQGFASAQQVTDQASTVTQLEASVAGDKAAIFNAQTQLGYTTITSPIDGVTGIKNVDIGNIVQPGSTTANRDDHADPADLRCLHAAAERTCPRCRQRWPRARSRRSRMARTIARSSMRAALLLVNNTINQSSGTVQLKATFPNANRALWPGEFVNVRLIARVQHDGVTVPLSALQQGQNGSLVYVVQPDGTVQQRPVTVAQTLDGRALIDQGLKAGDTVVTAGQYRLSDGIKVAEVAAGSPQVQDSSEASAGML